MNILQRSLLRMQKSPKFIFGIVKSNAEKCIPMELCSYSKQNSLIDRLILLSAAVLDFNPYKDMRCNFLHDYLQEIYDYIRSFWTTEDIIGAFEGSGCCISFYSSTDRNGDAQTELQHYLMSRLILFKRLLTEYHNGNKDNVGAFFAVATYYSFWAYRFDKKSDLEAPKFDFESEWDDERKEELGYSQFLSIIEHLSQFDFNLVKVPSKTWITEHPESERFHTEGCLPYLAITRRSDFTSLEHVSGCVNIKCRHCGYAVKEFPAFIHGAFDALIGRQCPQCGEFCSEENHSKEYHMFGESTEDFVCKNCGYTIRSINESIFKGKGNPLFCPKCESTDLEVSTVYMT